MAPTRVEPTVRIEHPVDGTERQLLHVLCEVPQQRDTHDARLESQLLRALVKVLCSSHIQQCISKAHQHDMMAY